MNQLVLEAIHSGGQTGGDQGGLAAAVTLGMETGGWIPKGWKTELGSEPWLTSLGLKEHSSRSYPPRTRLNVKETDGTFWFGNPLSPGGKLTLRTARQMKKPYFVQEWYSSQRGFNEDDAEELYDWLVDNQIRVLNVAGNRESSQPGIAQMVHDFLVEAILE